MAAPVRTGAKVAAKTQTPTAPSKSSAKKTFDEALKEADDREREESLAELLGGGAPSKKSSSAAASSAATSAPKRAAAAAASIATTPSRARPPSAAVVASITDSKSLDDDVQALDPEELAEEVAAFGLDLGELDLTSQDIALDEVDDDLQKFQKEEIVREALEKGVDLRNYSWTIEAELRKQEAECIRAYVNESDNLASLHNEITHCDNILATMETMLTKFQDNLGEISTEIKALQDKSVGMNIKLRNRVAAGERLSSFVKEIQVSDDLQKSISEAPVGEPEYIAFVEELSDKIRFLSRHEITNSKAARDVAPKVDRLKAKAISRISHFLLAKFGALKKPGVDVKDKRKFIKLAPLYQFLVEHAKNGDEDIAAEVRRSYMDVLSKLYLAKFKAHFAAQKKLVREEKDAIVKTDLIAMDEAKTGVFSTRRTNEKAFLLGARDSVLGESDNEIIDPLAASAKGIKYSYERIFRSSLQYLMEHAAIEFDFLAEFFGDRPAREEKKSIYDVDDSNASLLPDDLMKPSDGDHRTKRRHRHASSSSSSSGNAGGSSGTATTTPTNGDSVTTTSTTEDDSEDETSEDEEKRLAKEAATNGNGNGDGESKEVSGSGSSSAHRSFVMSSSSTGGTSIAAKKEARRAARHGTDNPNSTDKIMFSGIFHKTNQLFQEDLEGHLLSCHDLLGILILIRINHSLHSHPSRCLENFCHRIEAILWPKFKHVFEAHMASINALKAAPPKKVTTRAHFVTIRYGELCAGIHRLNRGYDNPMLIFDLKVLRSSIEKLLMVLRAQIQGAKNQSIFLINNYFTILRILKSRGVDATSDDLLHFVEVSNQEIRDGFAKLEFNEHFPKMMQWLSDVHDAKETRGNDVAIEAIVKHFGKNWRDNVEKINNSVLKNFDEKEPGGRGGDDGMIGTILKIVYAELVGAAQSLRDAIDRFYPTKKPSFYADLVPQTELIHHMRKYNRGQEEEEPSGGHDEEEIPIDD